MSGFIDSGRIPVKPVMIGVAVSIAVTLLLMCLICLIMTFSSVIPYQLLPYVLLIADAGGVFCGAYVCAALNKSKGLILGLVCGFILFIILFIAGLSTGGTISLVTLLRFIVLMVFGTLGGIKGVNKKERIHIK